MNLPELNKDNQQVVMGEELVTPEVLAVDDATQNDTAVAEEVGAVQESLTKEKIVELLKEKLLLPVNEVKDQVNDLKQAFYQIYNAEQELRRKEREAQENTDADAEVVTYEPDELEVEFKNLLQDYKQKKAAYNDRVELEREQNQLRKEQIIECMKELTEKDADVSNSVQEFRQLQQAWREIGAVSPSVTNELWKKYNFCQENFYDLLKINQELREYDFKKNLEQKTLLCEQAEALGELSEVVVAFRELQRMHDEWKTIGPVSRELRDAIWARFQAASLVVNKKHQDYFSSLHQQEKENYQQKLELCEKIEAIDTLQLGTFKQWEEKNQEIVEVQNLWRQVGFASRKENQQIYERYRAACDHFFSSKSAFYKKVKSELSDNLTKKRALCEQAEQMKDSTDWKVASEKFVQMQKDWKAIGSVPKKYSDDLWKRFMTACDSFFEQKKSHNSGNKEIEHQNLAAKIELIEQLESFEKKDSVDASVVALKSLSEKFNAIGFVPFKEKDKIYKRFKTALNKQFEELNVSVAHRRLDTFKNNLEDMESQGESKLLSERRRLMRIYDTLKSEIQTAENNIGFFSSKSKSASGLVGDMEQKIVAQRKELLLVEQKITLIDEKLKL